MAKLREYLNENNSEKKESEYKQEHNARVNYNYFVSQKDLIKDGYKIKVWNTRSDVVREKNGSFRVVETIDEPIYVCFSWTGINNESYSFPLSFHVSQDEFNNKLECFLSVNKYERKSRGYN